MAGLNCVNKGLMPAIRPIVDTSIGEIKQANINLAWKPWSA